MEIGLSSYHTIASGLVIVPLVSKSFSTSVMVTAMGSYIMLELPMVLMSVWTLSLPRYLTIHYNANLIINLYLYVYIKWVLMLSVRLISGRKYLWLRAAPLRGLQIRSPWSHDNTRLVCSVGIFFSICVHALHILLFSSQGTSFAGPCFEDGHPSSWWKIDLGKNNRVMVLDIWIFPLKWRPTRSLYMIVFVLCVDIEKQQDDTNTHEYTKFEFRLVSNPHVHIYM